MEIGIDSFVENTPDPVSGVAVSPTTATIGTPVRQLDVESVVKASQSTIKRDCPLQADRETHANSGGACWGRTGSAYPSPGRRAADRGGGHHRPRQSQGFRSKGSHYTV